MWWLVAIGLGLVVLWVALSWVVMAMIFWNAEHSHRDGICACQKFALSGRPSVVTQTTEHSEHRCSPLREVVR